MYFQSRSPMLAALFWIRSQEYLYSPGSAILVLMLYANGYVRYPTVEAEDAKLRVSGCSKRRVHVCMYSRKACHDRLNSISSHNGQQVARRSLRASLQPIRFNR